MSPQPQRQEDPAIEPEEIIEEADPEVARIEERARKLGWVPIEEWRGDEKDWRPAGEFLDRVAANPAIFNERFDKLEQQHTAEIQRLERQLAEAGEVLGEIHGRFKQADVDQVARAKAMLEKEMRTAVEEADTERYDAAKQRRDQLVEPPAPQPEPARTEESAKPAAAAPNPIVEQWVQENPWFRSDVVLNQAAQGIHVDLLNSRKDLSLRENLDEVTRQIKQRFSDRFQNERRQAPSSVAAPSGDRGNGARQGGRSFSELPEEDKRTYERLKKQFKTQRGVDYTQAEYLADYPWS